MYVQLVAPSLKSSGSNPKVKIFCLDENLGQSQLFVWLHLSTRSEDPSETKKFTRQCHITFIHQGCPEWGGGGGGGFIALSEPKQDLKGDFLNYK